MTKDGCTHPSLTRYSDEIRFDTDILHLDNDTMTRVVRSLNKDLMAHQLDAPMSRGFIATTQGLDKSMAYRRSDGAMIQANVFDIIQKSWHWGPDNAIDECYNNKMSEKVTMQIER